MAPVMMGSVRVFILRFPPERFATLVRVFVSIGTLGNIFATSPFAYLTSTIGWRTTFILAGFVTMILVFSVLFFLVEEDKKGWIFMPYISSKQETGILKSIRLVLRCLTFWQIGTIGFFRYGILIAFKVYGWVLIL